MTGKHPYTDAMEGIATPDFIEVSYRSQSEAEMPAISKVVHSLYDENHDPNYFSFTEAERRLPVEPNGVIFGIDVAGLEVAGIPHDTGI